MPHAAHRAVGQVHPQALRGDIASDILETQNIYIATSAGRSTRAHGFELSLHN